LYYFILLIYIFIKPLSGVPFNDSKLKFFLLIQNNLSPKDFVQSWSLCIEEQFYLIFPFFIYKLNLKKMPSYFWLIPGLFSTLVRFLKYTNGIPADAPSIAAYNYHFSSLAHLDGISWGVFLASSFKTWSKFQQPKYFLLFGIVSLFLILNYINPLNINAPVVLSFQLISISFSCILIGLYHLPSLPAEGVIRQIATLSYGVYLWNNLISRAVEKLLAHQSNFLKFFTFISLTFLVSFITYLLIEKPSLKLRSTILAKLAPLK